MVEDRPFTKTMLPFTALPGRLSGDVVLEYHVVLPDGQKAPYRLEVGSLERPSDMLYYPLGQSVYRLMQMFWSLENQVESMAKERDESNEKRGHAEAEAAACKKRYAGLEAEMNRQKGKAK